jgi:hypothetical protein
MEETWTQRADNVLSLMEKIPAFTEAQKEFHRAVLSLCQKIKDSEAQADGGSLLPQSIMGD